MTKTVASVVGSNGSGGAATIESVADILESELHAVIVDWLSRGSSRSQT
jgi:hypothetical protein